MLESPHILDTNWSVCLRNKDPESTGYAFRGGWIHTGDVAVIHPDGYIELKNWTKDVTISGGENVSSLEVERVIFDHPDVQEVAVVATTHERWDEVPESFVVVRSGEGLAEEELITHCRLHLAEFTCPKVIEFVDALSKTATGKIQKYALRDLDCK